MNEPINMISIQFETMILRKKKYFLFWSKEIFLCFPCVSVHFDRLSKTKIWLECINWCKENCWSLRHNQYNYLTIKINCAEPCMYGWTRFSSSWKDRTYVKWQILGQYGWYERKIEKDRNIRIEENRKKTKIKYFSLVDIWSQQSD